MVRSHTPDGAVNQNRRGGRGQTAWLGELFPTPLRTEAESVPGCLCLVALVGQSPGLCNYLATQEPASGQSPPVRKD